MKKIDSEEQEIEMRSVKSERWIGITVTFGKDTISGRIGTTISEITN